MSFELEERGVVLGFELGEEIAIAIEIGIGIERKKATGTIPIPIAIPNTDPDSDLDGKEGRLRPFPSCFPDFQIVSRILEKV